jgi:hypothetical protein
VEIRDAHTRRLLAPHWKLTDAIVFARRALVVAIEGAQTQEISRYEEYFAHWSRTADLASLAQAALGKLIKHRSRLGVAQSLPQPVPRSWVKSGRIVVRIRRRRPNRTLETAHTLCAELVNLGNKIRSRRRNEGNPRKRAAVFHLAVAWVHLTGKLPGSSIEAKLNPFLRFVEAAWEDAGSAEPENFARPLQAALKVLKSNEQALAKLVHPGPVWR